MKIRQITELELTIKGTNFRASGANEKACIDTIAREHSDIYKKKYFENLAKMNGVETYVSTFYFADSIVRHFAGRTKEEAEQIANDFFSGAPTEFEIEDMVGMKNESNN